MKRTSSSSCQCSELNLLSIASRLGVCGVDVDDVGGDVAAARLELVDLVLVGREELVGRRVRGQRRAGRRALVVDAARREKRAQLGRRSVIVRFSSGMLTIAMGTSLTACGLGLEACGSTRPEIQPSLEQELQNLDVPFGVGERAAPRVEAVALEQERVRRRVFRSARRTRLARGAACPDRCRRSGSTRDARAS